jgi:predicted amidohydrolase
MTLIERPYKFRVAALQPGLSFDDLDANLDALRRQLRQVSVDRRPDLVVLPEVFEGRPESGGPAGAVAFLQSAARGFGVRVIGGSCLVTDDDGQRYNRCLVFDAGGRAAGHYDKRVLFASESRLRVAGEQAGVFELSGIRVGVLICADLWHPELARELLGRIDVLAIPIKSSVPAERQIEYARSLWHAMALTRAMENGFVVVVSDWSAGRHELRRASESGRSREVHYTSGAACIVDPSQRPDMSRIQRLVPDGGAAVLTTEIDLSALATYRSYRQGVGLLPGADVLGGENA